MSSYEKSHRRPLLCSLVALLLAVQVGCATKKPNRDFPTRLPPAFSAAGDTPMPNRWWREFGDSALNFQVEQALGGSYDLATALHRLRAAQAITRREASNRLLHLDGFVTTNTEFGPGPNRTRTNWGLDAAYQVDLWGQIQSRVDAERFRAQATRADYHAVALAIAAEVTRTWFSLIEAHAQLELLEGQLKTNRDGLKSQEGRFGIGEEGGGPDLLRQRQLVESTLEQIVVVKSRVEVLEHHLAVLTGQFPQTASYDPGNELPELPRMPDTGLPSELLMRRPDVRAEFLAFVAADHDLAAAMSDQYPRFDLSGSLVNSANSGGDLFRDWFVSISSQLVAPLIDGGRRAAEVDRTSALVRQRFNEYGQTMLIAFQEVEDGLTLERYQIQRIKRLNLQAKWAGQAAEQLKQRFIIGTATYLDYLSATQSAQRLQREILSAKLDLILIRIGLYLALAGDFDTCPQQIEDAVADNASLASNQGSDQTEEDLAPPKLPSLEIERLVPVEPTIHE